MEHHPHPFTYPTDSQPLHLGGTPKAWGTSWSKQSAAQKMRFSSTLRPAPTLARHSKSPFTGSKANATEMSTEAMRSIAHCLQNKAADGAITGSHPCFLSSLGERKQDSQLATCQLPVSPHNITTSEQLKLCLKRYFRLTFTIESSSDKINAVLRQPCYAERRIIHHKRLVKPTNTGHCLNRESECPQRYKDSTIGAYMRRALTHCSTWQLMHKEIERSTQVLINNGFSERDIIRQTKKIMENWYNRNATKKSRDITIFYRLSSPPLTRKKKE
ncbi:hypothetical protein GWK47_027692 [Chionoecetes opilio]|uniref:Helix-turn-helix domain-containing protein n=1 Tax=Chionoecetes opilio TaxID=41210 RepID=A0A8J8WBJ1_CHIOP|nr:hypothetical protein GWK47_027692 [Chionoecetes opilio]